MRTRRWTRKPTHHTLARSSPGRRCASPGGPRSGSRAALAPPREGDLVRTRKRPFPRGGASGGPALFPRRAPRQALTWLPSAPPSCGSETNAWLGAAAAEVRCGARWGRSWGGHGRVIVGVEGCSTQAAKGQSLAGLAGICVRWT